MKNLTWALTTIRVKWATIAALCYFVFLSSLLQLLQLSALSPTMISRTYDGCGLLINCLKSFNFYLRCHFDSICYLFYTIVYHICVLEHSSVSFVFWKKLYWSSLYLSVTMYMLEVHSIKFRTRSRIFSKLTTNTPKERYWHLVLFVLLFGKVFQVFQVSLCYPIW